MAKEFSVIIERDAEGYYVELVGQGRGQHELGGRSGVVSAPTGLALPPGRAGLRLQCRAGWT